MFEECSFWVDKPIVNGGKWLRSSVNTKKANKQAKLFCWWMVQKCLSRPKVAFSATPGWGYLLHHIEFFQESMLWCGSFRRKNKTWVPVDVPDILIHRRKGSRSQQSTDLLFIALDVSMYMQACLWLVTSLSRILLNT